MTISLTCPDCFRDYRVRDELAGKRVKCKACGSKIHITKPASVVSEDDDFLNTLSDAAKQEATADALGGYDANVLPPRMGGAKTSGPANSEASPQRKKRKKKSRNRDPMAGLARLFQFGLAVAGLLLLCGLFVPHVGLMSCLILMGIVSVGQGIGALWVWILAFQEDIVCGLLFFVPFYGLYYLITRWEDAPPFWLVGYGFLASLTLQGYLFFLLPVMAS
jgi:hypothetical protein